MSDRGEKDLELALKLGRMRKLAEHASMRLLLTRAFLVLSLLANLILLLMLMGK